jgi:hypothetical protein
MKSTIFLDSFLTSTLNKKFNKKNLLKFYYPLLGSLFLMFLCA